MFLTASFDSPLPYLMTLVMVGLHLLAGFPDMPMEARLGLLAIATLFQVSMVMLSRYLRRVVKSHKRPLRDLLLVILMIPGLIMFMAVAYPYSDTMAFGFILTTAIAGLAHSTALFAILALLLR